MSAQKDKKLSKDEVEALLERTGNGSGAEKAAAARRVESYDFFQPSRFNKSDLEKLRRINAPLAQSAAQGASRLLRKNVRMQLVNIDQMRWEHLLEDVGSTMAGYVFEMPPFGSRSILTVEKKLAAACLDQMLGGAGKQAEGDLLGFTDLEAKVFGRFVQAVLAPLPELWRNIGEFTVELGAYAEDLQGASLFPPSEDMFQLTLLMQGEFGSGQIAISVPFDTVRSLPPSTDDSFQGAAKTNETLEAALRDSLQNAPVDLSVLLGVAEVGVRKLLQLEPGDVLVLDTTVHDALQVRFNDRIKARGYPGVSRGRITVKLIGG